MLDAVQLANVVMSGASAVFCLVAVNRPERLLRVHGGGPVVPATRFYAWFYALRQLPLSVAVVIAVVIDAHSVLPVLLMVAGAAQAGDAVLGVRDRNLGMMLGAAIAAVTHLGSVWWWL